VVRVVVGPHQVVDDAVLLGGVEADVILLERCEAVALEVRRRQVGDHRADPHVVGLVGVVHGLDQPWHEADARLDEAGLQVGVALEDARRDHLHQRLDRGLHAVADVVDDRPALAADGAGIATGRHVERQRDASLGVERPELLERLVVVLEVAPLLHAVDRAVAEREPDEAVLRSPLRLGEGEVDVAGGDRRQRAAPAVVPALGAAEPVVGPAVPRPAHRVGEHRIGRGPAQQALVREDQLDVDAVARLVVEPLLDRQAALVAHVVLGLHAALDVLIVLGLLERLLVLHGGRRGAALDQLRSVALGDHPLRAVVAALDAGDAVAVLRVDVLGQVRARLLGMAVGRHHVVLVRVAGVGRMRPAFGARSVLPPEVARRFGQRHRGSSPLVRAVHPHRTSGYPPRSHRHQRGRRPAHAQEGGKQGIEAPTSRMPSRSPAW
jgi:hypothetical protein